MQVKLPKLEWKSFDGRALSWQSFLGCFDSSIHKNTDLNDIDKFSYLQSFLWTSASQSIYKLTRSAENYTEAINLLHERYGNTQVQISAHVKQFLSLPPVKSMNGVPGLWNLIDELEGSVRNLKSLKVDPSSYGILLVPLINEKLPTEMRLLVARKFGNKLWDLSEMLRVLKHEMEAKEQSVPVGDSSLERHERKANKESYFTCFLRVH